MTSNTQQQRAAAVATFLALFATALYTVLYHASASGVREFLATPADTPPPAYTGLAAVDGVLHNLVALFHAGFHSSPYAAHFLVGLAPGVLAYVVEYSRTGSLGAGAALAVGMAFQVATTGATMPLAWLALVLHRTSQPEARPMDRTQAQAAVGGVLLGYVLPTALMLALHSAAVTALWQIFPLFVWALQTGWLRYVSSRRSRGSASSPAQGLPVLQCGFGALALLAFVQHLRLLAALPPASRTLTAFLNWWPSFRTPAPGALPLGAAGVHLLQWTSIVCYAAILAGAAFLRAGEAPPANGASGQSPAKDAIGEVLRFLVLAPLLSPGAAIALLWMRREARLAEAQTGTLKEREDVVRMSDERKNRDIQAISRPWLLARVRRYLCQA